MLIWSKNYLTNIELIDEEHKLLFTLLNDVSDRLNSGDTYQSDLEQTFKDFMSYSEDHFYDEEQIMKEYHVDARFIALEKVEHNSFIYDLGRIWDVYHKVDNKRIWLIETEEFVTHWVLNHTLTLDIQLGEQIELIKQGWSPRDAYEHVILRGNSRSKDVHLRAGSAGENLSDVLVHDVEKEYAVI